MDRRRFFRKLTETAAIIALAPKLAFGVKRERMVLGEWPKSRLLIRVDDSCGCTLTRASILHLKPEDFSDLARLLP